jgi:hypothetical protein
MLDKIITRLIALGYEGQYLTWYTIYRLGVVDLYCKQLGECFGDGIKVERGN